jgi:hypothetical protein
MPVTSAFSVEGEGEPRLIRYVAHTATPDEDPQGFETQMRQLYDDLTGIPLPDKAPEPEALITLWRQVYAVEGSTKRAWAAVVSAVPGP